MKRLRNGGVGSAAAGAAGAVALGRGAGAARAHIRVTEFPSMRVHEVATDDAVAMTGADLLRRVGAPAESTVVALPHRPMREATSMLVAADAPLASVVCDHEALVVLLPVHVRLHVQRGVACGSGGGASSSSAGSGGDDDDNGDDDDGGHPLVVSNVDDAQICAAAARDGLLTAHGRHRFTLRDGGQSLQTLARSLHARSAPVHIDCVPEPTVNVAWTFERRFATTDTEGDGTAVATVAAVSSGTLCVGLGKREKLSANAFFDLVRRPTALSRRRAVESLSTNGTNDTHETFEHIAARIFAEAGAAGVQWCDVSDAATIEVSCDDGATWVAVDKEAATTCAIADVCPQWLGDDDAPTRARVRIVYTSASRDKFKVVVRTFCGTREAPSPTTLVRPVYNHERRARYLRLWHNDTLLDAERSLLEQGVAPLDVIDRVVVLSELPDTMQVFVKPLTGKTLSLNLPKTATGRDAQLAIQRLQGIPPDQQRLIFARSQLAEDTALVAYGVLPESTLHLVLRLRGGGPPCMFVDVARGDLLRQYQWSNEAPPWRIVEREGVCLEGECTNPQCAAYKQMVIVSVGCARVDVCDATVAHDCPKCRVRVTPTTCAFNRCQWRWSGVKQDGSVYPVCEWRTAGNAYHRFDDKDVGSGRVATCAWRALVVEACRSPDADDDDNNERGGDAGSAGDAATAAASGAARGEQQQQQQQCKWRLVDVLVRECAICCEYVDTTPEARILGCRHAFHTACIDAWAATGHAGCDACPYCRAPMESSSPSS